MQLVLIIAGVLAAPIAGHSYPDLLNLFSSSQHATCKDAWPNYIGCRYIPLRNGPQAHLGVCNCAQAASNGWCLDDYYTVTKCRKTCELCNQKGNVTSPNTTKRTVIMIHKQTMPGEQIFIRGGITSRHRSGCGGSAKTDPCAIHIKVNQLDNSSTYEAYDAWRHGDTRLDWHGAETGQGLYQDIWDDHGRRALGTPMAWTTNNPFEKGYHKLNTFGSHYWVVDMDMDCSQTQNGWFNVRALVTPRNNAEHRINQNRNCHGASLHPTPFKSFHHIAKCGYFNLFKYNDGNCFISKFNN